jgi:fumarate hydratase, class II
MMQNVDFSTIPKAIINPLLLNTLEQIYSIRAKILGGGTDKPLELDCFNNFSDGRGVKLMQNLDEIFCIEFHKIFPTRQYELFNSSFLDSIYITALTETKYLIKELKELNKTFESKENAVGEEIYKIGRSNGPFIEMQAKKMYANWREYLAPFVEILEKHLDTLKVIPLGSEINAKLDEKLLTNLKEKEGQILSEINKTFEIEFSSSKNRINSYAQLSPLVELSGSLNSLASVLMKIANDVRFLSSGPRSGYGELTIPENEPGSSIMPGKVNPTQCESLTMVSCQVIGNHTAITIANSSALFESNNFKPLIANNLLRSIKLLEDGIRSFNVNCAAGVELIENKKKGNF